MPSLLKGALFYLAGVVYAQSNSFGIDFLHPREGEVITADSTYTVTWAANGRTGTGTITLFAGETSASLKKLWEIAYGIDVAGQSFSWPVGYPTPEAQLARLYALTFTLDTKEGISAVSPSFEIAEGSSDNNVADGEEYDDDSPGSSEPKSRPATTSLAILSTAPSYTPSLKPILTDSQSSSSTMSTVASIPSQSGLSDLGERPGLSPTEIGGIAIGTVVAIFIGVIVLILYRRRRVLHLKRPSNSHSSIYGLFRKAELDAEGQEIKGTKLLCELDATREVQELDSRMKPAELDPTVVRYELPAADVERQHESTHTTL